MLQQAIVITGRRGEEETKVLIEILSHDVIKSQQDKKTKIVDTFQVFSERMRKRGCESNTSGDEEEDAGLQINQC